MHLKPLTPGGEVYPVHPPFYSEELIEIFQYSIFIVSFIKDHLAASEVKFRLINNPGFAMIFLDLSNFGVPLITYSCSERRRDWKQL